MKTRALLVLAAALPLCACANLGVDSGAEETRALAYSLFEAMNEADVERLDELYAEDFNLWTAGSMPGLSGDHDKQQALAGMKMIDQAFPTGITFTIKAMTVEGGRAAIEAVRIEPLDFTPPSVDRHELEDVSVLALEDRELPIVNVYAYFKGGYGLLPRESYAAAMGLPALMRNGGTLSLAPDSVEELLEFHAIQTTFGSAGGSITSSLNTLSDHLDVALDLWTEILAKSPLMPGSQNLFTASSPDVYSHVRLNIFPDGGVARLRVYGKPAPDWDRFPDRVADLAALENGGYDLYVVDLDASGSDALDLVSRSRADETSTVVVTSSSEEQQIAVRAFEGGAAAFLKKPFLKEELDLKLSMVLRDRDHTVRSRHLLGDLLVAPHPVVQPIDLAVQPADAFHRADLGAQQIVIERLGDEAAGTDILCQVPVLLVIVSGHEDGWHTGSKLCRRPDQVRAGHFRHGHIGHDDVVAGRVFSKDGKRFFTGPTNGHLISHAP